MKNEDRTAMAVLIISAPHISASTAKVVLLAIAVGCLVYAAWHGYLAVKKATKR